MTYSLAKARDALKESLIECMRHQLALAVWGYEPGDERYLPVDAELPQRSVMTDRNGRTIAVFYGQNRQPVALAQISPAVVDALLATEDDRFYEHGAADLPSLARVPTTATVTSPSEKRPTSARPRRTESRLATSPASLALALPEKTIRLS